MKRLYSGGASRKGSRGILVSVLEPLLDFPYLVKEHLNSRHSLTVAGSGLALWSKFTPFTGEGEGKLVRKIVRTKFLD